MNISKKLQQAREYEEQWLKYIEKNERPAFHVTGSVGWINDPNGFSVYRNEYHLFFQYHPYSTLWGPMHWGHVKTKDFISWERLPVAMAPDASFDEEGCFSGSAIELDDGRQLLMYTGVCKADKTIKDSTILQQQCVAIGDGIDFEKIEDNPVISSIAVPNSGSIVDFRDPKIFKRNGRYYAVIGDRSDDDSGMILLYESSDCIHWTYSRLIDRSYNQYGKMWECPDYFELDGKQVLLVSPQEMLPVGLEFHAGYNAIALIGTEGEEVGDFTREKVHNLDYGLDFYAPQTLKALDGRRIMIAWMQNWTTHFCKDRESRIFGQMTLPRELSIRGSRIIQNPVRELKKYRTGKIVYDNILISDEIGLSGVKGRCIDMTVNVRPIKEEQVYKYFKINVAKDGEYYTSIRYKPENNTVRIDRSKSGFPHDIVHVRDFLVTDRKGEIRLRLVMDRNSLELFVNDGEQAASTVIFTDPKADSISFSSTGGALIDVEKYDLKFE